MAGFVFRVPHSVRGGTSALAGTGIDGTENQIVNITVHLFVLLNISIIFSYALYYMQSGEKKMSDLFKRM